MLQQPLDLPVISVIQFQPLADEGISLVALQAGGGFFSVKMLE